MADPLYDVAEATQIIRDALEYEGPGNERRDLAEPAHGFLVSFERGRWFRVVVTEAQPPEE